jgi:hypothetical protein
VLKQHYAIAARGISQQGDPLIEEEVRLLKWKELRLSITVDTTGLDAERRNVVASYNPVIVETRPDTLHRLRRREVELGAIEVIEEV